jgi:glutathione synthase/RimK-type ligase-like ATP-grasp enzyme
MDLRPLRGLLSILRLPAGELPALVQQTHAEPDVAHMCMQMFYLLMALGQHAFAVEMQARALQLCSIYRMRRGPGAPALRLLAIMGPGDMMDNTPIEFLLEDSDVQLDIVYLLPGKEFPTTVPDHDVAIVAMGESDKNSPSLIRLATLLEHWPRPVLNQPQRVLRCARDVAYQRLHDIAGVVVPRTQRLTANLFTPDAFPITIRPVDTHAGVGLEKLEAAHDLGAYFERFPSAEYFVADFVDYRSEDGLFKKFRIALVAGKPYLCHVALSVHWMVHYMSAHMEASADKRAQEAAAMDSFDHDFAIRHGAALKAISDRMGLDYLVLDCAEMSDGRLLVFEVDSRAFIHATDPVDIFPYKQKAMQKAFDAFRALLAERAAGSPASPA